MISVLVASRERAIPLERSIESLGDGDFEVLVRVDEDDPQLDAYGRFPNVVAGPRHGYEGLHHYYNELAERARGDWLFLWNDDCLMQTPDWIDVIRSHDGELVVLNPKTNHDNWAIDMNVFPVVPRKLVELMGHFSLSRHNDSWMECVGRDAGIMVRAPITIVHDRADLTGNNDDAIYADRRPANAEFHSPEMASVRESDVRVIREYLAENGQAAKVGFVGLGKLGLPVALALESRGYEVYGWDASPEVRENVRARRFPNREEGLPELLERSRLELLPVDELVEAVDIVFVAVQTPHEPSLEGATRLPDYRRDFDYSFLTTAVESVARAAAGRERPLTLAVISTVLPGTMERELQPLVPLGVELAYNPYFTAMGTTIGDFLEPEFVLIGAAHRSTAASPLTRLYRTLHGQPVFETDVKTAELIKVAYNTFIGQKIVFANAMMELCHKVGADVDELAAALGLADDRIVSPRYLRGGMGDGGPCHPRDNIALSWLSGETGLSHDIFGDVMRARENQTEWLADLIADRANGLPVVVLGKAFKPESDLAAGSPALLLASILEERGVPFAHHDGHVDADAPPLEELLPGLFFVATRHPEYGEASFPAGSIVLDPWGYIQDQDGVTVVRIGRR